MSPQTLEANSRSLCWYRCELLTTGRHFEKLVKKLRNMILTEISERGPQTNFAKTIVYIIRVLLVYLESAKTYTGPKIFRVLKRLGNTVIELCPI